MAGKGEAQAGEGGAGGRGGGGGGGGVIAMKRQQGDLQQ